MVVVKFKRVSGSHDISLPRYQTPGSAAFDLHAAVDGGVILKPGDVRLILTGFQMEFPQGFVAQISPRSGLALKHGISVVNTPGLVDSDYRGEVGVILVNHGKEDFVVNRNDRIAQMTIKRVEQAEIVEAKDVSETKRSSGGFGSTGK